MNAASQPVFAALQASGATFGYGAQPLLRGLSLEVRTGEFLGIIGPNGAGKSTFLRLLAGSLAPRSGHVLLSGTPIGALPPAERARRLAFVPQESRPAFDFSVMQLVLLGRSPHLGFFGVEGARDVRIAREALEFTDTAHLEARPFAHLSSGERQRVVLARALAQQAPLILLDEPTAFLDLGHQHRIYELLTRLSRERGTTIVVVSHDLNLTARHCGRLLLMRDGEILAEGPPRDVLTPPLIARAYEMEARIHEEPGLGPVVIAKRSLSPDPDLSHGEPPS
jgi:iron complex transport system ATP-binding protein